MAAVFRSKTKFDMFVHHLHGKAIDQHASFKLTRKGN